jgi:hypothetical protein
LIADGGNSRALEICPFKNRNTVVREFTANGTLRSCFFASRLPNGNTLLIDGVNAKIIEVDRNDTIVWQYITNKEFESVPNPIPTRGLRLRNGDTIISNNFNNQVIIINPTTIIETYGLPLNNSSNSGYDQKSTQQGLYCPRDAKVIGDYTGITDPYVKQSKSRSKSKPHKKSHSRSSDDSSSK